MESPALPVLPSKWASIGDNEKSEALTTAKEGKPSIESESYPVITGNENVVKGYTMLRTPSSSTTTTNGNGTTAMDLFAHHKSLPISRTHSPNPKTSMKWKGKTVIIQIPSQTSFGLPIEEGGRPIPLSIEEVEERRKFWESSGYDADIVGGDDTQSKAVYPEEKRKDDDFEIIVRIPDRRDWEAYCENLREEKLRALGVGLLLSDEPSHTAPPSITNGQTPMSHHTSPGQYPLNTFSPPPPTSSATGFHRSLSAFSPALIPGVGTPTPGFATTHMPSPIGTVPNHHLFHIPRQSVSMNGTPSNVELDYGVYTPPPQAFPPPPLQTFPPPPLGGGGVWTPPFAMRNGSPGFMNLGMHGSVPNIFNPAYPMEDPNEHGIPNEIEAFPRQHYGVFGMDRYYQQQMPRGSPLAYAPHYVDEINNGMLPMEGPAIDAPVPKHRHHLSLSLQKELDVDHYHREEHRHVQEIPAAHSEAVGEAFATNTVLPAPMAYPQQPEMPSVETDIHNGPELASNPEDGIDQEAEKGRNRQAARDRDLGINNNISHYAPENMAPLPMPEVQVPMGHYVPQYPHPHSKDNSLSQHQHEYDTADPCQNSATSMLMAGEGMGAGAHLGAGGIVAGRGGTLEEYLSEDGRTNISDIVTNPSEPPSPIRKYSTTSHAHQVSNNSNAWTSDNTKPPPSTASSVSKTPMKFNAQAAEFKFDPTASFTFAPKNPFTQAPSSPAVSSPAVTHSREQSGGTIGGFGGFGGSRFNVAAATFRPSLLSSGSTSSLFEKGAAAFSPNAPAFIPSSLQTPPPAPSTGLPPIFGHMPDIVEPGQVKKTIPIVRPPSRPNVHEEHSGDELNDRMEDSAANGGRKRVKHRPTSSLVKDADVPALESYPGASQEQEVERNGISYSSDEGEKLMSQVPTMVSDSQFEEGRFGQYDFTNSDDAAPFAQAESRETLSSRDSRVETPDRDSSQSHAPEQPKELPLKPSAKPFIFHPTAQEFNFDFTSPSKSDSPTRKFETSTYNGKDADPLKTSAFTSRPMPSDAELDAVIKHLSVADPIYANDDDDLSETEKDDNQESTSWKAPPPRRMCIPVFDEPAPSPPVDLFAGARSDGATPNPHQYIHRASSFSPDEEETGQIHAITRPTYQPPAEEIGIAKDAESDNWDDMASDEDVKLRPQSRLFFDSHVEEFVGGLLRARIEPVHKSLTKIHETLKDMQSTPTVDRLATEATHSDADDEDELGNQPSRSPRRDKFEKLKVAVIEALSSQNGTTLYDEEFADIRSAIEELTETIKAGDKSEDLMELKATIVELTEIVRDEDKSQHLMNLKGFIASKFDIEGEELSDLRSSVIQLAQKFEDTGKSEDLADLKAAITQLADIFKDGDKSEEVVDLQATLAGLTQAFKDTDKSQELAELKETVTRLTAATARGDDLMDLKSTVLNAIGETAKSNDLSDLKNLLKDPVWRAAQVSEMNDLKSAIDGIMSKTVQLEDVRTISENVEDMLSKVVQSVDLVEIKLALQDVVEKSAQKNDITEVKVAISNLSSKSPEKEDLLPICNSINENISSLAKTADLEEIQRNFSEISQLLHESDLKTTHGEVLKLGEGNADLMLTLGEVLKLTQNNAENADFHHESQEGVIRQNQAVLSDKLDAITSAVAAVAQAAQQRTTKIDMRRSLQENDQKESFQEIKAAVMETKRSVEERFSDLSRAQPSLDDFRSVIEKLSNSQPQIADFKAIIEEVAGTQPKLDDLKSVASYVISTQQKLDEFNSTIREATESRPMLDDFRAVVEEIWTRQPTVTPIEAHTNENDVTIGEMQRRIGSLEKALSESQQRAEEEIQLKWQSHENVLELQARLKISEEEAVKQRELAEENDRRLKAIDEERSEDLEEENKKLRRAIESLGAALEESIRVREGFRGKFDKLQEDMRTAAMEIGNEQGKWRKAHEEHKAKIDVLEARLAAEITTKEGFEREVKRLELTEKEAIKSKIEVEGLQRENGKLSDLLYKLRSEAIEHQQRNVVLTHEIETARQSTRDEVTRVTDILQSDLSAAKKEVNVVRADLEKEIEQARSEIDRVVQAAAAEKEEATVLLEEAYDAKKAVLQAAEETKAAILKEAAEAKSNALQEQHRKYERQLEELRSQHERFYKIATEDAKREDIFFRERLNISQSESKHLREHISHLQEQVKSLQDQVKLANSAAQAAAQVAATVKASSSHSFSEEKALRETVDVLQNQLQEREAHIERLEEDLSGFDKNKIKQQDEQITWLRTLLEVRIDELNEIIHTLSLPNFDRLSLRDAAIRLRTNLQMEQQEKERSMAGNRAGEFGTALAARLPVVATAAWSSWMNKARSPADSGITSPSGPSQTPSRPSSAAGFFNNILPPQASSTLATAQRFGSRFGRATPDVSSPSQSILSIRQREKQPTARRGAPQLFNRGNYDPDADSSVGENYGEDDEGTEIGVGEEGDIGGFDLSSYRKH